MALIANVSGFDWGLIVATIGVLISILIAVRQEKQLLHLHEITVRFRNDRDRKDRIEKFFKIRTRDPNYSIIYPSHFVGKPLESVHAGDYFALAMINTALISSLSEKNVALRPVPRGSADMQVPEGDSIFICSPAANSMLRKILPTRSRRGSKDVTPDDVKLLLAQIPCWFVEDFEKEQDRAATLKIWDWNDSERAPLKSPAEETYDLAIKAHEEGTTIFVPPTVIQEDYAILMRTKGSNGNYNFVLAGIHQYGTWMAAKYLHDFFEFGPSRRQFDEYCQLLLGDDDFLVVLQGEFSHQHFRVMSTNVKGAQWVWRKRDEKWERQPES